MKQINRNCEYHKCLKLFHKKGKYCCADCRKLDFNLLKNIRKTNMRNN